MRIGKSNTAKVSGGLTPATPAPAPSRADAAPSSTPAAPIDVATIAGLPQAELTPQVRAALGQLMAEVQRLREELTQSKKRIEHLETLADQDALAPVLNRRAFVRELTRMIAYAERYDVSGSVIYFDVDSMKQVNDRLGHAAGDAVLRHIANVLVRESRASDIVGRLGGDEYAVILTQADAAAASAKAAILARAVAAEPVDWKGEPLTVSLSYGIFAFAGGEAVEQALDAADKAMYARKHGAKGGPGGDAA